MKPRQIFVKKSQLTLHSDFQETGGAIREVEEELTKVSKEEAAATAKRNACNENIVAEERNLKQLQKSIKNDETALSKKENEMQKVPLIKNST